MLSFDIGQQLRQEQSPYGLNGYLVSSHFMCIRLPSRNLFSCFGAKQIALAFAFQ